MRGALGLLLLACACRSESQAATERQTPLAAASSFEVELPPLPAERFAANPEPARVGHAVSLGESRFVIWGALEAGLMPKGLATDPHGRWLFSSNMGLAGERTLSAYRSDPLSLERHLDLEGKAIEVAVSQDGNELFVTNSEDWGKLLVLGIGDLTARRQIAVPGFPKWMTVHPDGRSLFVSLWALDGISRVALDTERIQTLRTPKGAHSRHQARDKNPRGMALSQDLGTLVVANNADETLSFIDTSDFSERKRLRVGYAPRHIVRSRGSYFVSLTGNDSVLELDEQTEHPVREIPVGKRPKTIALSRDERFLYVANFTSHSLSIIDTRSQERVDLSLDLHKPSGLAVRSDDRFIYVSGFCTHDVWAIERLGPDSSPTLPFGNDRINEPCFDCPSSFEGCPYYGGPRAVHPGWIP